VHPHFLGGGQEKGLRAGTENTAMIAGLGQAAEVVSQRVGVDQEELQKKRDMLERLLKVGHLCTVLFENKTLFGKSQNLA
jgi:cysteine sulfinate desulfinase/cysteine desulfurase-like protein